MEAVFADGTPAARMPAGGPAESDPPAQPGLPASPRADGALLAAAAAAAAPHAAPHAAPPAAGLKKQSPGSGNPSKSVPSPRLLPWSPTPVLARTWAERRRALAMTDSTRTKPIDSGGGGGGANLMSFAVNRSTSAPAANSSQRSGLGRSGGHGLDDTSLFGSDSTFHASVRSAGGMAVDSGTSFADEDSDVGSLDEDSEDYTWFATGRRGSGGGGGGASGSAGGGRRAARARQQGEGVVYDRVRINDVADEINELKQKIGDGSMPEADGKDQLRKLEEKIYTISIGDALEIYSGDDDHPYVGKLSKLIREKKRCVVQWFFTREEVREPESAGVEEREVLLADNVSTLALDTVKQKVKLVHEMPSDRRLPDNTYLYRRDYDSRKRRILPMRVEGKGRKQTPRKKGRPRSQAGAPASPCLMTPSQDDSDDEDDESHLLRRWNRLGPEYDVHVSPWKGPREGLKPSQQERHEVEGQMSKRVVWSASSSPLPLTTLQAYLTKAKALAPILPGTLVYLRPRADGRWGDGRDRDWGTDRSGREGGSRSETTGCLAADPGLCRVTPSRLRWALVTEAPASGIAGSRGAGEELGTVPSRQEEKFMAEGVADLAEVQQKDPQEAVAVSQDGSGAAAGGTAPLSGRSPALKWSTQMLLEQPQQQHRETPHLHQQEHYQELWLRQDDSGKCLAAAGVDTAGKHETTAEQAEQTRGALSTDGNKLPSHPIAPPTMTMEHSRAHAPDLSPPARPLPRAEAAESVEGRNSSARLHSGEEDARGLKTSSMVWIANPCEGSPPLWVERWRVMGRAFEEEALKALTDHQDDFEAALTRLSSPEFRQEYRDCLERAGEIWTHEEVAAAVKTCIRVSAARRNEGDEELGDDAGDRSTYGLESKSFRQVVDFGRRFTKWARFGQPVRRREDNSAPGNAKRSRPKHPTHTEPRKRRRQVAPPSTATASNGGERARAGGGKYPGNRAEIGDRRSLWDEDEEERTSGAARRRRVAQRYGYATRDEDEADGVEDDAEMMDEAVQDRTDDSDNDYDPNDSDSSSQKTARRARTRKRGGKRRKIIADESESEEEEEEEEEEEQGQGQEQQQQQQQQHANGLPHTTTATLKGEMAAAMDDRLAWNASPSYAEPQEEQNEHGEHLLPLKASGTVVDLSISSDGEIESDTWESVASEEGVIEAGGMPAVAVAESCMGVEEEIASSRAHLDDQPVEESEQDGMELDETSAAGVPSFDHAGEQRKATSSAVRTGSLDGNSNQEDPDSTDTNTSGGAAEDVAEALPSIGEEADSRPHEKGGQSVGGGEGGGDEGRTRKEPQSAPDDLQAFMQRIQDGLDPNSFEAFVNALGLYRSKSYTLEQMVAVVSSCFDPLQETHQELMSDFNGYLPPGMTIPVVAPTGTSLLP